MSGRTPWSEWMREAALRFGLSPEAFWRTSVAEWRALLGGDAGAPMSAAEFERLRRIYPDEAKR